MYDYVFQIILWQVFLNKISEKFLFQFPASFFGYRAFVILPKFFTKISLKIVKRIICGSRSIKKTSIFWSSFVLYWILDLSKLANILKVTTIISLEFRMCYIGLGGRMWIKVVIFDHISGKNVFFFKTICLTRFMNLWYRSLKSRCFSNNSSNIVQKRYLLCYSCNILNERRCTPACWNVIHYALNSFNP